MIDENHAAQISLTTSAWCYIILPIGQIEELMNFNEKERLRLKAEVFKAMGHPLRLGIIEFLQQGEMCVCDIVAHVGTETSNVSKHLSILKKAGIVTDRRDGLKIMYSLTMSCALDFMGCVEGVVIKRLDEQRSVMVA
jgi:DNA-binding transcriptional ArsR family regulator